MTDTPPYVPPRDLPPVVDQASLEHAWRALVGGLQFECPQIWALFLEQGHCGPLLAIDQVPLSPDDDDVRSLARMLEQVTDDGSQVAFLFARPGHGRTAGDLAWARSLGMLPHGWPVHVANDVELRVVAPDDLAAAG